MKFNEEKRVFDTGNIKKLVCDGLPSAKDLDAVAEEERIKWLTSKRS